MTVTMQEVQDALSPDEVNYPQAATLGPEALKHLAVLIGSEDALLASKAAYLASLIDGDEREQILQRASHSPEPTVRLAATAGLRTLSEDVAEPLLRELLTDKDPGVRKQAVLSTMHITTFNQINDKLRDIARNDSSPGLRNIAQEALDRQRPLPRRE